MDVIIYHNPDCGTSRNTLAMIRNAGIEPRIVEYLKTPPSRAKLAALYARAGIAPRDGLRTKEDAAKALIAAGASDDAVLDAMIADPILIERPLVETDKGAALCRPQDKVRDLL